MKKLLSKIALDDLTGRIRDAEVLNAFETLVNGMSELGRYELRPNIRGNKKALHFVSSRICYYAFVANNHWLLWYFRKPGFRDNIFTWEGLRDVFPDLDTSRRSDPEKCEAVLRVKTAAEAERVLSFVNKCSA